MSEAAEVLGDDVRGCTPSQTVGPFLHICLPWDDGSDIVPVGTPGAIRIEGRLVDGAGEPVPDGMIELWQADPDGGFNHPDDPRGPRTHPGFRGFGRCDTDTEDGSFWFRTLKPGALPAGDGEQEAPHIDVSVFSRGLLQRLVTRIYFAEDAEANAADPVFASLTAEDQALLTAVPVSEGVLRFDIHLQGESETPFFAI